MSDLISREAAIAAIEAAKRDFPDTEWVIDNSTRMGLSRAVSEVSAVPSPWVSVNDRLPKDGVRVLTRYDPFHGIVKDCQTTVCGYFSDARGAWVIDNEMCEVEPEKVTHWMELPAPPVDGGATP